MSMFKTIFMATLLVLLVALTATPASNSEQLVFSTPGFSMALSGNSIASSTPFGFWIWCAAESSPKGKGGYQNFNACQGSMYFYGLDHNATHVIDNPDEPLSEGPDGVYTINVEQGTAAELFSGTLDPSYSCSLTNLIPDGGHLVAVNCTFSSELGGGTGTAIVNNAVVNVSGPK